MILFRYAARRTFAAFVGSLAGVVAIFLAVDFVDNSASFTGPGWIPAVLELYANKTAVVVRQVAPAAMVLGAAIAVSTFRRTREYTAMRALGLGPWRLAGPVAAVTLLAGAALVVVHDVWGVEATARAEEIRATRFSRGVRQFQQAREPKRWFRSRDGRRIYHLGASLPGGGFARVTVLAVTPDFRLAGRIDAARMRPDGDAWMLEEVQDRTFLPDGSVRLERADSRRYEFPEPPEAFAVVPGRPSQLRWRTLVAQIAVRRHLGLATEEFQLERYDRVAYPFAGVPGALLAVALALRRNRKGHVSAALVESVGVSLLFWGVQGVSFALGLSGRVAPWVAAWAPNALFLALGIAAVRRAR
ncbi:LptF/LptG family permease [Anaeromyxobacter sp. Fw109-5]|uniref:LptF/LptG family permease n=1 Tax=Anaeromyxobacter sp. (strain Fw109-5) TaxID=404589 RepID=UPI000158A802|nr:LptF/LptG family permease [Anaeromyxobacter sp. Fw109-5]ABS28373.1 permease YjgP/YjgQ family protein [Anaeromyxobacter sp. Fw109-5]